MAFQHRLRRIVIGLGLIFFAICACFPGLYLYAFLMFTPGVFLTLSGCLDEFPDDEPEAAPHIRPFYARPWFLLLLTLAITAGACGVTYALASKPEPADRESVESPFEPVRDPDTWIEESAGSPSPDEADEPEAAPSTAATIVHVPDDPTLDYVLNTSSKKFHSPSCGSVDKISAENREDITAKRSEIIDMGYEPCGNCTP